ncbi:MAG: type II toxin-antitoxin system PemK/MazF family toxin [Bradyrhizobium sp.]|nr:type II toxin-antitoxin system PemK/MazF family toxin [Bradyrhizobium sp.]
MKRGDVVLLVAQGDMGKPRPGVIVQADELGDTTNSVLVCPMSSDVSDYHHLRPVVEPSAANGLRLRSQIPLICELLPSVQVLLSYHN